MNASLLRQSLLFLLLCISPLALSAPAADKWNFWEAADNVNATTLDHSLWQDLLDKVLVEGNDGINRVSYRDIKGERKQQLNEYLQYLESIDPRDYSKAEQLAYWINFYNAATVKTVISKYPVKSIRNIGWSLSGFGPWNDDVATIAKQDVTLNDIEHRILRPYWEDYRLHFVLNCASIGCPNLLGTAFTAENVEQLLSEGAITYLKHKRGQRFEGNTLVLSSIFEWYGSDFGSDLEEMLETIAEIAPEEVADKIAEYTGDIRYEYDWNLNDHK